MQVKEPSEVGQRNVLRLNCSRMSSTVARERHSFFREMGEKQTKQTNKQQQNTNK